jgi:hypothetical protein
MEKSLKNKDKTDSDSDMQRSLKNKDKSKNNSDNDMEKSL